jgi:hypothetical protein
MRAVDRVLAGHYGDAGASIITYARSAASRRREPAGGDLDQESEGSLK